jgi:hypothetical protein
MISVEKSYGKRRVNVGFGVLCSGKMYGILDSGGKISTRTREGSTQSENEIGDFQGSRKKGSGRPSGGPREFGPGPAVGGGGRRGGSANAKTLFAKSF